MPAITLGLAEVEERLHALRRRINAVTVQHGAYVGGSTMLLFCTLLIFAGVRGSASTFRIALWAGALFACSVLVWCVWYLRRRWLDIAAVARLADRRGELMDRLTTLIDLRARPRPSRLAPILIAQVLALSARWHPRRIAPRRVPRSVFLLIASLVVLCGAAFLERRGPEPSAAAAAGAPRTASLRGSISVARLSASDDGIGAQLAGTAPSRDGAEVPSAKGSRPTGQAREPGRAPIGAAHRSGDLPGSDAAQTSLTALPDRLQQAIRRAFDGHKADRPDELASRSSSSAANSEGHKAAGRAGQGKHRQNSTRRTEGEVKPETDAKGAQAGRRGSKQPRHGNGGARRDSNAVPNPKFEGTSPAAGDGSSPGALANSKLPSATGSGTGPKTFKLTITSFLQAMVPQGRRPSGNAKRGSGSGPGGVGVGSQVALNERQLNDDAVRKAEIPPEYEDIVRRVYSSRATP